MPTCQNEMRKLGDLVNFKSATTHQQDNTRSRKRSPTITHPRTQLCQAWVGTALGTPLGSKPAALWASLLTSDWQPPHKAGPGNQPDCHGSQPATTEENTQFTEGATLENITLVTRGECTSEAHRTLFTRGHFSKYGKFNQHTRYTEIKTANQTKQGNRGTRSKRRNKIKS